MNDDLPNNVVRLDRHILVAMVSLKLRRATLEIKFGTLRDSLYRIKNELTEIDAEMAYFQKQYDRHFKKD